MAKKKELEPTRRDFVHVHLIHDAPACEWPGHAAWSEHVVETLPKGTTAIYCGHVYGGMILIELPGGRKRVIHPGTTKELS